MGASVTHLHKLDSIQKMAERVCGTTFMSLASRRNASSIGLLCKLLDLWCRRPLQNFCPVLTSVTHAYSFRHVMDDSLLLQQLTKFISLDLFINSFLGIYIIPSIWATIPLILRERDITEGWFPFVINYSDTVTNY